MRWCAAGVVEAGKQFRRVNGTCTSRACARPSDARSPKLSEPPAMMTWSGLTINGPLPKFHGTRDILAGWSQRQRGAMTGRDHERRKREQAE